MQNPTCEGNVWRRNILPRLLRIGLGWANFQVMRRTHASIMKELGVDPKWVADQLGHSLDVSQNVYTQVSVEQRLEAVQQLELALVM
jgi:integrase